MLVLSELNVTTHAMNRWSERGYLGNSGLQSELQQAKPLNQEAAQLDEDLKSFLHVSNIFSEKQGVKEFHYTKWFIFVLVDNNLVTCISRNSHLSTKPRKLRKARRVRN